MTERLPNRGTPPVSHGRMWLLLSVALAGPVSFTPLEPGLELAQVTSPAPSPVGDSTITILRADPAKFDVVVLSAGTDPWRTAGEWVASEGLVAATNPGMFEPGGATTFFGRVDGHDLNPARSSKAQAWLVTGSPDHVAPPRVVDSTCDVFDPAAYGTAIQTYRLLDCAGKPTWTRSPRMWSHAVYGQDDHGRLLFVHVRSPYSTHDIATILKSLDLGITRLAYGEGGPEATLVVHAGSVDRAWVGSYETGFREDDTNTVQWPLPNVLGLRRR